MCPLDTNAAFLTESRKRSTQPIFLYTIFDYDGIGNNKCYAAHDTNVVFDSITYEKFPVTHDAITENVKGEIDSIKIQISNISRQIEFYLQTYDLRGKTVTIRMVWANLLDDPDCYIEFSSAIDSYTSNVKDVVFNLMSKFDVLNVTIPGRTAMRNRCNSEFKGAGGECGYTGSATECNKTRQRCKELGNGPRFDGRPSAPGRRTFS